MRLRNRVRQAREALGLTQSKLAEDAGMSRMTLRAIERDDGYQPISSFMSALAEVLNDPGLFWWESRETAQAAV